jgi:tight adherence protein B
MTASVLAAAAATLMAYVALSALALRRDSARAVRRLAAGPAPADTSRRAALPLLTDAAHRLRGRLAYELLERLRLKRAAEGMLDAAAIKWGAAGLLHRSIGMFLGGFGAVTLATANSTPLLALGAGAFLGALPLWYVRRAAGKRVNAFEEQFPDCLEFLSRSMRAGHAFSASIEMIQREYSDPLAAEFHRIYEEQNLGQALEIVLQKLARRIPSMDVQYFVSAVLLQKRTGGNLAEVLDNLAKLIRERFKLRARIRAVSAQGLMTGRILASIPAGVGALMFVMNPQYARFFIDDAAGRELLGFSLGLQFVGYLIIRKIVSIEV